MGDVAVTQRGGTGSGWDFAEGVVHTVLLVLLALTLTPTVAFCTPGRKRVEAFHRTCLSGRPLCFFAPSLRYSLACRLRKHYNCRSFGPF